MFSYLTPQAVYLSPWQLKFPQEIALTPLMMNWVNIWRCPQWQTTDNAHISTPGQRTCLWRDEMEWKLFHHITWQSWHLRNSYSSTLIFQSGAVVNINSNSAPAQLHFLIYSKLNCISPHGVTAKDCEISLFCVIFCHLAQWPFL